MLARTTDVFRRASAATGVAVLLLVPTALVAPARAQSAPQGVQQRDWRDSVGACIEDRLELGMRWTYFKLTNPTERTYDSTGRFRWGFFGSIDQLAEDQIIVPLPYARFKLFSFAALELGYERMDARAITHWDGHEDGDISVVGPTLQVLAMLPNPTIISPYIGCGIMIADVDFQYNPRWHHGFDLEDWTDVFDQWVANGMPAWPNNGYQRNLLLEDDRAIILSAGASVAVNETIAIDIAWRYIFLDIDGESFPTWYGEERADIEHDPVYFPFDNWALQVGAKVTF